MANHKKFEGRKIPMGITVDPEVDKIIDERRGREKKATYVNYLLRSALGLETVA
jgi:hypothetical protein